MTEASIDGLTALTQKFKEEFPIAQASADGPDQFIKEYSAEAEAFKSSMPSDDQEIYKKYLKKHGLEEWVCC